MSPDPARICYLDGRYPPLTRRVSVLTAVIFGDAVYEVIPVIGGRLFAAAEHFARFARSLAALDIPDP